MLMLYKDIQLLSKLLILNDFKKENENDKVILIQYVF